MINRNIKTPAARIETQRPGAPTPVHAGMLMRAFTSGRGECSLLYGEEGVFPLAMLLLAQAAHRGMRVAVVDGCNRLNIHALVRYARQQQANPDLLLGRVFVSRGFTCYQMEAAVGRLPLFLRGLGARTAIILGLLDTFYDEQAPFREVEAMLRRIVTQLGQMRDEGLAILLCNVAWNVLPRERNVLLQRLKEGVDTVYHVTTGGTSSHIALERGRDDRRQRTGEEQHGQNSPDLYRPDRERDVVVEEIPPRPPQRGPGDL